MLKCLAYGSMHALDYLGIDMNEKAWRIYVNEKKTCQTEYKSIYIYIYMKRPPMNEKHVDVSVVPF